MQPSQFLRSDAELDLDPCGPSLGRARGGPKHALNVGEAVALSILAACGDADTARSYCSAVMGESTGPSWVDRVVDRFRTYLGECPPRELSVDWLALIRADSFRRPPRRQAAPSAITWLVTLGCNRKCPYCFYNVTHHPAISPDSPSDATFPLADVLRMVVEMAEVGASDLYLTGGEPLLRKDILEVIAAASRLKIRVRVVTKYPVNEQFARELAAAGLYAATISLDDARPHVAAALAGAPDYLQEAKVAIQAFLSVGIPLKVNAVVSRVNQDRLCELAETLVDWGVQELAFSPYVTPNFARPNVLALAPPGSSFLDEVEKVKAAYGNEIHIETGGSTLPEAGAERACGRHVDCDVGTDALDVLPDGHVTRCRYLPHQRELIVGDLTKQTIMDVWNGPALAGFASPGRAQYEPTECAGCGGFEACNSRGRCYFTALSGHGRLYAPDVFCKNPMVLISTTRP